MWEFLFIFVATMKRKTKTQWTFRGNLSRKAKKSVEEYIAKESFWLQRKLNYVEAVDEMLKDFNKK